jgi:hypothetical protein
MLYDGTFEGKDLNQGYRRGKGGLLSFLFRSFIDLSRCPSYTIMSKSGSSRSSAINAQHPRMTTRIDVLVTEGNPRLYDDISP